MSRLRDTSRMVADNRDFSVLAISPSKTNKLNGGMYNIVGDHPQTYFLHQKSARFTSSDPSISLDYLAH